jgi:hypothetical protein
MVNTDNYKMDLLITAPSRILGLPAKNGKDWIYLLAPRAAIAVKHEATASNWEQLSVVSCRS